MLKLKQIVNMPISSNCFVLYDKAVGNDCIVVDPGSKDNQKLYNLLEREKLTPSYIILTHEHFDHCWGVNGLRDKYKEVKLICSSTCSMSIQNRKKNLSVFYKQSGFEIESADILLEDNSWKIEWNNYIIFFSPAQGHTASGVVFSIENNLFTGDELIKEIKTVTKLKTGSKEKLKDSMFYFESLKGKGYSVYPGHGDIFEMDNYDLSISMKGNRSLEIGEGDYFYR